MKKMNMMLSFLFIVLFICACTSKPQPEPAKSGKPLPGDNLDFFDPVYTYEDLASMEGLYDLTGFAGKYTFETFELSGSLKQAMDMCYFNGKLYIADLYRSCVFVVDEDMSLQKAALSVPGRAWFMPYTVTPGADGNLYVITGFTLVPKGAEFSIDIFDADLNYLRSIPFVIKSTADTIWPRSLILAEDGGFYFTLYFNEKDGDGKIFYVSPDGDVSAKWGNKSFGKLASVPGGLVFVNDGLPMVYNRAEDLFYGQAGLSALYKITDGEVTARKILPPSLYVPYTEEEIEAYMQIHMDDEDDPEDDHDHEHPSELAHYGYAQQGYAALCRSGDEIFVFYDCNTLMHVFDLDLQYKWSQDFDVSEIWSCFPQGSFFGFNLLRACSDDDGAIYLLIQSGENYETFFIMKGSPIAA